MHTLPWRPHSLHLLCREGEDHPSGEKGALLGEQGGDFTFNQLDLFPFHKTTQNSPHSSASKAQSWQASLPAQPLQTRHRASSSPPTCPGARGLGILLHPPALGYGCWGSSSTRLPWGMGAGDPPPPACPGARVLGILLYLPALGYGCWGSSSTRLPWGTGAGAPPWPSKYQGWPGNTRLAISSGAGRATSRTDTSTEWRAGISVR